MRTQVFAKRTYVIVGICALLLMAAPNWAVVDNDVTFYGTTDVHYGVSATVAAATEQVIDCMNLLPGMSYPSTVGGGTIATPRGVIVTGDLTNSALQTQFDQYKIDFSPTGSGARLHFPVYEGWGNHDGGPTAATSVITAAIKQRNLLRPNLKKISTNGYHYSWDWGHVHFINTNIYPGDVLIPDGNVDGPAQYPLYSLQFLKDDLTENVGDTGKPVVILMHFGMDPGWGLTWWSTTEQTNFYNAIKNYNVIAIIGGHSHSAAVLTWNGLDAYTQPAGQRDPNPGECFIYHITQNNFVLVHRFVTSWGSLYVNKVIQTKPGRLYYLKSLPDGAKVTISGKTVTCAQGTGGVPSGVFYMEEPNRSMGFRIHSSTAVIPSNTVTVTGNLGTIVATGERCIIADTVSKSTGTAVKPLVVNGRSMASSMLNGMLVRMGGKVQSTGSNYYTISDGYANTGGQVNYRVETGGAPGVSQGDMVTVTGIASINNGTRVILKVP